MGHLNIFLTGATGYIGSAILDAAIKGGHRVATIARDPQKVAHVQARGATAVLAALDQPERWLDATREADVVIHAALEHPPHGPVQDRAFLDRVLPALPEAGSAKALIYTSGIWVLGPAPTPADETAPRDPGAVSAWRAPHELLVLAAASDRLRTAVVRPGIVYGGGRGIVSDLLKDALNGLVRVVGTGDNHWPLVYHRDLGELYVRIAESPQASGLFHANDEGDERVNDIVEAIANHVTPRPDVRHMPIDEARAKMGRYAEALACDQRLRSPRARGLGWTPSLSGVAGNVPRLLEEYRNAHG